MSRSEHEIQMLDQEYGRIEDFKDARHPERLCPTCKARLIFARGVAGEPMQVLSNPTCPNCGWEKQ